MDKSILNELNRAREIMGLNLLKEEDLKENIGFASSAIGNGNGQNFGLMGTPTEKYKDLLETDEGEETDEVDEMEHPAIEDLEEDMDTKE